MSGATVGRPEVLERHRELGPGETFSFACHPGLSCFGACCADVNIVLTPLDVLGLARRLGLNTTVFLARHAITLESPDLGLPVVTLRMEEREGRPCPFAGPAGCSVYEDRPWACRMYPVGMALPPARAGERPEPRYFLFEDAWCLGGREGRSWTVETWRADQGIPEREEIEAGFRALVSHPWFIGGRRLDPRRASMFFTACYDLDRFRAFVFESSFRDRFVLDHVLEERLAHDDLELLRFGFRWLRFAVFGERTLQVRPHRPGGGRST